VRAGWEVRRAHIGPGPRPGPCKRGGWAGRAPALKKVLGYDSIETTLRFYIHASANAEQRIGAMMNVRWIITPAPASNEA
jgi:hypothetical protein